MTDLTPLLSELAGPLDAQVEAFVEANFRLWEGTPDEPLNLDRRYRSPEKKRVESDLSHLIDALTAEQKKLAASGSPGQTPDASTMEKIIDRLRPCFKSLLGRLDLGVEAVYDARFVDSTRAFLRMARDFDPGLSVASVFQALRNVWIMNTLQFYVGREVKTTDAVFGYSMIYPYLDNLLDDAGAPESEKLAKLRKLKSWLEGGAERPADRHEEKIQALVGMVEREFSRSGFPQVFQSMLAIYNAQIRSLKQQTTKPPPDSREILRISLEKGGTSVLADGFLVAGDLAPGEREFCFGFGALLQLTDDLQDIGEDLGRGHMTLFSGEAGKSPLDGLVNRLGRYTSAVIERTLDEARPGDRALRVVIPRNCLLMAMESVGVQPAFFSRACVRAAQEAFPVRFSYLAKLRKKLKGKFEDSTQTISDLDPLTTAFMAVSSRAFALG